MFQDEEREWIWDRCIENFIARTKIFIHVIVFQDFLFLVSDTQKEDNCLFVSHAIEHISEDFGLKVCYMPINCRHVIVIEGSFSENFQVIDDFLCCVKEIIGADELVFPGEDGCFLDSEWFPD